MKSFFLLLAVALGVLCNPCMAISLRVDSFEPVSPDEAARWVRLLNLGAEDGIQVRSTKVLLRDVTMSVTRIESASCSEGICPTYFKYQAGKEFEFSILCKEELVLFDVTGRDTTGKYVVSLALAVGQNLTVLVTPTSLGPIITAVKDTAHQ